MSDLAVAAAALAAVPSIEVEPMVEVEPMTIRLIDAPWYARIIEGTCASIEECVYVEIGVETGASIRPVSRACRQVHGVDPQDCEAGMPAGSTFWHMPSDRFFTEYDGDPPNVVFVDGLHIYEQARRDYVNACKILAAGGLIFLHDTCPRTPEESTPIPPSDPGQAWCGDVHRLREELEGLPIAGFTWRAFPGLTMVCPPHDVD